MSHSENLRFLFLNGKGSSGKDTQAEIVTEELPYAVRLSTGEIYRSAATATGPYARFHDRIAPYIEHVDNGGYVPDPVMLPIVKEIIEEEISHGKQMFVFTGFPRTLGQLNGVDKMVEELSINNSTSITHLYFAVLDINSKQRASSRRDQALAAGTPIRRDDRPEILDNRLSTFKTQTLPMLRQLVKEKRLCIIRANTDIDSVSDRLFLVINA